MTNISGVVITYCLAYQFSIMSLWYLLLKYTWCNIILVLGITTVFDINIFYKIVNINPVTIVHHTSYYHILDDSYVIYCIPMVYCITGSLYLSLHQFHKVLHQYTLQQPPVHSLYQWVCSYFVVDFKISHIIEII